MGMHMGTHVRVHPMCIYALMFSEDHSNEHEGT